MNTLLSAPRPHGDREADALLLMMEIDLALLELDTVAGSRDRDGTTRILERAVRTCGSVRHALLKLDLDPQQRATIAMRLAELLDRLHSDR